MREDKDKIGVQTEGKLRELRQRSSEFEILEEGLEWAEEELRESETKYRLLFDSAINPITVYTNDGTLLMMNIAAAKELGGIPNDFVGKPVHEIHPSIADTAMERIRRVVESGESRSFETILELPSGKQWFWSSFQPVKDASGSVYGVQIISYNITERKKAEEVLRRQEEKYRAIVDKSPLGMSLIDKNGRYQYVNPKFVELFGYTIEDVPTGREWFAKAYPDQGYREQVISTWITDLRSSHVGELRPRTFNVTCRDGSGKVIQFRPVSLAGGDQLVSYEDITERKRAEEALRESEEKYRILFESKVEGVVVIDETMKPLLANQAAVKIFGFDSVEELLGVNPLDLVPQEERDRALRTMIEDMFENDLRQVNEFRFTKKSGEEIWISAIGALTVYQGKPAGLASFRDITERKRAEETLQESEEKLRLMFESVTDGIAVTDLNGVITDVNDRVVEMHGFSSRDELLGRSAFDLIASCDHERATENMQKTLEEGAIAGIDYNLLRKDGSSFPGELSVSVLKDVSGTPVGFVAITRDITERKRAEEALREAEEKWRSLTENSPDHIMLLDPEGNIVFINRTVPDLSKDGVIGKSVSEFMPSEFHEVASDCRRRVLETGEPGYYSTEYHTKDGELRYFDVRLGPVFQSGKVIGLISSSTDITEHKRMEEQLRHSQLLGSLGEMTAGIAHEIGNPLASIVLLSELAMKSNIPRQAKKDLSVIHNEARRAGRLIRDLLAYSRRATPRMHRLDLHSVLRKVLDIRRYEQGVQNITVSANLSGGPLRIWGDSSQFTQVFLNLILNAEEALQEHRGGLIRVTTEKGEEWAKVSIADDGIGIPEENLTQVFYPFFTTRNVGEGTGLGLSTCYGIVTGHGGLIRAENNEMGGATFTVEIPLAKAEAARQKVRHEL